METKWNEKCLWCHTVVFLSVFFKNLITPVTFQYSIFIRIHFLIINEIPAFFYWFDLNIKSILKPTCLLVYVSQCACVPTCWQQILHFMSCEWTFIENYRQAIFSFKYPTTSTAVVQLFQCSNRISLDF